MPSHSIHPDFTATKNLLYDVCGFKIDNLTIEKESFAYGALSFSLNNLSLKFRVAKTTPTKVGQFVVFWKRISNGTIQPFDEADAIDAYVVSTRKGDLFGQFVFPNTVLMEKGIMSTANKEGKRALRVYPPWDIVTNKQAQQTQQWQAKYFMQIPEDEMKLKANAFYC